MPVAAEAARAYAEASSLLGLLNQHWFVRETATVSTQGPPDKSFEVDTG